jgi:uncharacterized membrane protein
VRNRGTFVAAVWWCAAVLAIGIAPVAAGPSFEGIGNPQGPDSETYAFGVSGDGSVVVGQSQQAIRWTRAGGIQRLAGVEFLHYGLAHSASYDGAVIGGAAIGTNGPVWPASWVLSGNGSGGLSSAGQVLEVASGQVNAVSADGRFAAGNVLLDSVDHRAYRWNLGDQTKTLIGYGVARGMSADGAVVVGHTGREPVVEPPNPFPVTAPANALVQPRAFRWTESDGRTLIGDPSALQSSAAGISADGTTIVGANTYEDAAGYRKAFRWTSDGGWQPLGATPSGWSGSEARAVSGDGSVVVGTFTAGFLTFPAPAADSMDSALVESSVVVDEAFIWDADHGLRNLQDVLTTDFGLDLTGWTLTSAVGISWDGTVIVGNGFNPSGYPQAWVATVPEPSCFGLVGLGAVAAWRRRRGR